MTVAAVLIFGLIIGSFLTVCIHRIPRGQLYTYTDEELAKMGSELPKPEGFNNPPRSHCPSCNNQLYWWHNIPVVSWIILRGRCGHCKAKIPSRYIFVELLSGLLALLCYSSNGLTPTGVLLFAFCCALLVITYIDYDYFIIPDVISLWGLTLGLFISIINDFFHILEAPFVPGVLDAFWGVMLGGGFLFIVSEGYLRLRKKEGLGLGDVKLLAMTGAFFGGTCSLYTIFLGSLLGSVIGISLVLFYDRKMSQHLPFGPYLALGTLLYLFGDPTAIIATIVQIRGAP